MNYLHAKVSSLSLKMTVKTAVDHGHDWAWTLDMVMMLSLSLCLINPNSQLTTNWLSNPILTHYSLPFPHHRFCGSHNVPHRHLQLALSNHSPNIYNPLRSFPPALLQPRNLFQASIPQNTLLGHASLHYSFNQNQNRKAYDMYRRGK